MARAPRRMGGGLLPAVCLRSLRASPADGNVPE